MKFILKGLILSIIIFLFFVKCFSNFVSKTNCNKCLNEAYEKSKTEFKIKKFLDQYKFRCNGTDIEILIQPEIPEKSSKKWEKISDKNTLELLCPKTISSNKK